MAVNPESYVLSTSAEERDRLVHQAHSFLNDARGLLDRVRVQPGWRAVDVGCGPLGILDLLAERVGPTGSVIGLDREPRFLAIARGLIAEWGLGNVELVQGELPATGLPRGAFDLAHARFVLIHSPAPEAIVEELVALVRPGGVVALQDYVVSKKFIYPPHAAQERLEEWLRAAFVQRGFDSDVGARLPSLLHGAGLGDIEVEARAVAVYPTRGATRTPMLPIYASVRQDVVAQGIASDEEFGQALDELRAHLNDPAGTLGVMALLMQAWGRKPTV
jgi:SAM-dependent methyltransferase